MRFTLVGRAMKANITGRTFPSRSCRWIGHIMSGVTLWRSRWPKPATAGRGTQSCASFNVTRCPKNGSAQGDCWSAWTQPDEKQAGGGGCRLAAKFAYKRASPVYCDKETKGGGL